jgi:hypothetical protein
MLEGSVIALIFLSFGFITEKRAMLSQLPVLSC